jgi:hypothetical protein
MIERIFQRIVIGKFALRVCPEAIGSDQVEEAQTSSFHGKHEPKNRE